MRSRPFRRAGQYLVLLLFALPACGLKVPVTIVAGSDPNASGGVQTGTGPDSGGGSGGPGVDATRNGPSNTTPTRPPGNGPPTGNPDDGGTTGLFPRETEGVTKDWIRICAHVPITGAAPIPHHPDRFGQFYFNWVNANGGVHGRKVQFTAYDDQYYPAGARSAVERCARQGAFMYFGAAGTDQIVSVAKWAEERKVPYMHGPASVKDLKGLEYSVHVGPTYEYQHELLADYLVKRFGKNQVYGMIRVASPYFDAGRDAFVKRLATHGVKLAVDRTVQKDEKTFTDDYYELMSKGVTVINSFTTPNIWINMLNQRPANYNPWWTSVSPVAGWNIVAAALATSRSRAVLFHSFNPACNCTDFRTDVPRDLPWYDDIQKFLDIFQRYSPEQKPPPDDFDYSAYLSARGIHRLLEKLGPNPTRSGLWKLLDGYRETSKEAFPACPSDFTRDRSAKIGAWSVNILELNGNKWKQVESCVDRV
ncbi:MAG: ABC transporter substrate-binding protein [Acidobacteria bacterium]|nr:ABC transporter substrate-binding protein [Acidobacteriota bacterium]